MDVVKLVVLALLQGFTEFLPVSSSAHLILVPELLGWEDQGLAFDIAVHVGTLLAVLLYFRREVRTITHDFFASLWRRQTVGESRLGWAVLVGTLPIVILGALFADYAENELRSPLVIASTTIGFGLLLWVADRWGRGERDELSLGLRAALLIGIAQAVAMVPGTSRSGITITAALLLGLSSTAAARFSFLLSIPAITLAGGWQALELALAGVDAHWGVLVTAALVSGVSAYLCIGFFLALLRRVGMTPFVIYRLLLGGMLLWVFA